MESTEKRVHSLHFPADSTLLLETTVQLFCLSIFTTNYTVNRTTGTVAKSLIWGLGLITTVSFEWLIIIEN